MVAKKTAYLPDRGDLIWLSFDPTHGHEQKGRRPAMVISAKEFNKASGLMLACPITSQSKGYPFEVPIQAHGIQGSILADQIRSLDWKARHAERIGKGSTSTLTETQTLLKKLLLD